MKRARLPLVLGSAALVLAMAVFALTLGGLLAGAEDARAQQGAGTGQPPGEALGATSDSEFWRKVRQGDAYLPPEAKGLALPPNQARVLIQSEGVQWWTFRNGPLSNWGAWSLLGVLALLAAFYLLRGRIRIDSGPAGVSIQRFNGLERFSHWLLAASFILLGLTGLNILYGRYVLPPVLGDELFADFTRVGKWMHNYVAFAFMTGLALVTVLWVRHNLPRRADMAWIAKGGGLLVKGVHPPSHKFNAGQKFVFWAVVLLGLSLSMSGIALMFPFQTAMFAKTFAALNVLGFDLPADISPMQEMQLAQLWHSIVALALVAVVLAHIYIGSLGMEGAFDAMGSGEVDRNWAREHHSLWVAELDGTPRAGD